ncbi:MAG TPA: hypothetical protein VN947_17050 [Polyangia bacterium]|nr:hypothetical protein [Polyangia bacterium]
MRSMGDKRESLEDVARREASHERELAEARAEYAKSAEKLAKEMPVAFFDFCGMLREGVRRFNSAADPQKRLTWRETAALAAREENLNADFHCAFGRNNDEVTVALNVMSRAGKPDVYLIEGSGKLGPAADRFLLRVEGYVQKGKTLMRITVDFKRLECDLEELAERLVLAAVKGDYQTLFR